MQQSQGKPGQLLHPIARRPPWTNQRTKLELVWMWRAHQGHDLSTRMTAATSAILLDRGMPVSETDANMYNDETQAAPAVQDSRPLSAAEPSVHKWTLEGLR